VARAKLPCRAARHAQAGMQPRHAQLGHARAGGGIASCNDMHSVQTRNFNSINAECVRASGVDETVLFIIFF
jgi:hypothetical protein